MNDEKRCSDTTIETERSWKAKIRTGSLFERALNLFFFLVCVAGVLTSIYMNFVNRSLWLDETGLAYSFSTRSFWTLWDGAFDCNQSAPLGWLYFEKLLTVLFGNTEFVLRIGSILGFTLTLPCLYYLLAHCFHVKFALGACAFYANLPFILKYSNVFKPYISDGLFVLLVILLFYLYEKGRIKTWVLGLGWAVLLWFSNPTCFFEGGLLISAGLFALIHKDWKKIQSLFFVGLTIGIGFIVYYFFWLREVAVGDYMQNFWSGYQFPLFPTSVADLSLMATLVADIMRMLRDYALSILAFLAIGFPLALFDRNKVHIGCYIGLLIALFASSIGFFPVSDRLWCFFYSLSILLAFAALNSLLELPGKWRDAGIVLAIICIGLSAFCPVESEDYANRGAFAIKVLRSAGISVLVSFIILAAYKKVIRTRQISIKPYLMGCAAFLFVTSVNGIPTYLHADNIYWKGEEINTEIAWLNQHIHDGEKVYVHRLSRAGFEYKNGYGNTSIGGYKDNVLFGQVFFTPDAIYQAELATILSFDRFYVTSIHFTPQSDERIFPLIDAMRKERILELVSFEHETPLWFCCTDPKDRKTHVTGNLLAPSETHGVMTAMLELHNDGMTWLNHWYEDLALLDRTTGNRIPISEKNIAPGRTIRLEVQWKKEQTPDFDLVNEFGLVCNLEQIATKE